MHRWIFLLFSSLAYFFAEIFAEQSAPLVSRLCGTANACKDGTDTSCLEFTTTEFNSLYVVHFWFGALAALSTGFWVGRYGIWIISCVTAVCLLVGIILFTLAPYLHTTAAAFPVMLIGRLIFSAGYFGQIALSHEVKSHWFFKRELALAFALYMDSGAVGAIVAMASVGGLVERMGLQNTLWVTFSTVLAPVFAIAAGWIYKKHASSSIDPTVYAEKSGEFGFKKVTQLGKDFWLLAGMVFLSFGCFLTALSDYPKFLLEVYGYSESAAGIITGLIADIAIATPLFGYIIDKFGGRDIINLTGTGIFFLAFLLFCSIPGVHPNLPIICSALIGIAFAILAAGVWGSVPLVTNPSIVGVAMGTAICMQAVGSGLMLLIAGFLLDMKSQPVLSRWVDFYILLTVVAGVSFLLAMISMYDDWKNPRRPLRMKHTVPAMASDMNQFVEGASHADVTEVSPLLGPSGSNGLNNRSSSHGSA